MRPLLVTTEDVIALDRSFHLLLRLLSLPLLLEDDFMREQTDPRNPEVTGKLIEVGPSDLQLLSKVLRHGWIRNTRN